MRIIKKSKHLEPFGHTAYIQRKIFILVLCILTVVSQLGCKTAASCLNFQLQDK